MGIFRVEVQAAKPGPRPRWATFKSVTVDSGAEATWLPEKGLRAIGVGVFKKDQVFVMANGQRVTRDVGIALLRTGEFKTVDEVVLARPGDLLLLGARALEGFNARVDARRKKLIAAGPVPAAGGEGAPARRRAGGRSTGGQG